MAVRRFFCLLTMVASAVLVSAQARPTKTLDIYVVDVEGGNATLLSAHRFRAPAGSISCAAAPYPSTPFPRWIKVSAQEDGTFTVTNARNGFSKVYRREIQGTR